MPLSVEMFWPPCQIVYNIYSTAFGHYCIASRLRGGTYESVEFGIIHYLKMAKYSSYFAGWIRHILPDVVLYSFQTGKYLYGIPRKTRRQNTRQGIAEFRRGAD
jgi:hypothetical protein